MNFCGSKQANMPLNSGAQDQLLPAMYGALVEERQLSHGNSVCKPEELLHESS